MRSLPPYPASPRRKVQTTYHGVRVSEDYRWLEPSNAPEVRRWTAAQNRYTRSYLDALPDLPAIRARYREVLRKGFVVHDMPHAAGGRLFALRIDTRVDHPVLSVYSPLEDLAGMRVLVDPSRWDRRGMPAAINHYAVSPDGRYVAVCASRGGTEEGDLEVLDARTGRSTGELVHGVARAGGGGDMVWTPDARGFFYSRYPRKGERPDRDLDFYQQVYFHTLGTPERSDRYVLGREFPRIAEVKFEGSTTQDAYLLSVAHGDGGDFEHWGGDGQKPWTRLSRPEDRVVGGTLGADGRVFLVSRKGAPYGKVLSTRLSGGSARTASCVIEEGEWIIEEILATPSFLVLREQLGGTERLRALELSTGKFTSPMLPEICAIPWMTRLLGDEVLFEVSTHLAPPRVLRWRCGAKAACETPLSAKPLADLSRFEVVREVAVSRDGTRVPMSLVIPRGLPKNGENPVLLTGYGGYGISSLPEYVLWDLPWIESGGVVAVAHLRGGGEYGDRWHREGMLTRKQNVFDDFLACAEHLVRQGYTRPERLAIEGGSNGGLLVGAALVQRPDLFSAVAAHVGIFDSLRSEQDVNGQYNVTEFGTVKDPKQFRALHAYSPYHHVTDGTRYPAVLFTAGENDRRVNPFQSRKMTARLQAATASGEPVLLRTQATSGHSFTRISEIVEALSDTMAFLMDRTHFPYRPV